MTAKSRRPAALPTRDQLQAFVRENPGVGKREIARAFRLDSGQKIALKTLLAELAREGALERGQRKRYTDPAGLPETLVLEVSGVDADGEVLARPATWPEDRPLPAIYVAPGGRGHPALGPGDRVLARLRKVETEVESYEAQVIRRLGAAPEIVVGVVERSGNAVLVQSTDKRVRGPFFVAPRDALEARAGELVEIEIRPGRTDGLKRAKIVDRLGTHDRLRALSAIAVHEHGIPHRFEDGALAEAAAAASPPPTGRVDLRQLPLVTIDGADARDFDDAVFAEPDPDPANPGGWHLVVAIADVGWYVRPGSALDRAAYERGNSVYFPDRVVPMLPEALSNGWCSLKPGEDRACLAAHLWLAPDGSLKRHRFERALMRSAARLIYEDVQRARDAGASPGDLPAHLLGGLYGAFDALAAARRRRGVLELDIPERRVSLGPDGTVERIETRARLASHMLVEEFMIAANVAAAETLERRREPAMYRVHDEPTREKVAALGEVLAGVGVRLAKGQTMRPEMFNRVLERVAGTPHERLVHQIVLRTQAQAAYSPDNLGHFGLNLARYCHFTSPIRRYADLLVHRALIRGLDLGEGGLAGNWPDFAVAGQHLSATERRAAAAERDTVDRYTAAFLAERVGERFDGRIGGVTRFGLFVQLERIGGDGLVPIRSLPDDFYIHDEARHELVGRRGGLTFRLGDQVAVRLAEADPVTGGILLNLADGGAGTAVPPGRRPPARPGRRPRR